MILAVIVDGRERERERESILFQVKDAKQVVVSVCLDAPSTLGSMRIRNRPNNNIRVLKVGLHTILFFTTIGRT